MKYLDYLNDLIKKEDELIEQLADPNLNSFSKIVELEHDLRIVRAKIHALNITFEDVKYPNKNDS